MTDRLVGIGTYTPAEAGRLLHIPPSKIVRWLRGHNIQNRFYEPLWRPEIDLGDRSVFLSFRDLMEVRVVDAFIRAGVPPVRIREAITEAKNILGHDHPLSTDSFRTDGRVIFVHVIETSEDGSERARLLNIFKKQYEFKSIIDPILKTVDFEGGSPIQWWPEGRRVEIVVDPKRSFGQPIDAASSVPTSVLANAARLHGVEMAAITYDVSERSILHAQKFEEAMEQRSAA